MSKGERCDRRQRREKGAERVAAVGKALFLLCQAKRLPGTATGKSNNAAGIVHLHGTRDHHKTKKALRREPFC